MSGTTLLVLAAPLGGAQQVQGDSQTTGIILLVLIGLVVAWLVSRGRRKMKLPMTGKHWAWIIIVVVVVLAIAYGASGHVSQH